MKKFIIGIVIGMFLSSGIVYAAGELNIIPNPYPVLIDGIVSVVDGYNINDSTYLKLRDFEKAGLGIDFVDEKVIVTSIGAVKPSPSATPTPRPTLKPIPTEATSIPDQTNIPKVVTIGDTDFVSNSQLIKAATPEQLNSQPYSGQYYVYRMCTYKGNTYYTYTGMNYWLGSRYPHNEYGITWKKTLPSGEIFIILYDGSSEDEVGAKLVEVYAKEDDIIQYQEHNLWNIAIKYDLVMELLTQAGIELPSK